MSFVLVILVLSAKGPGDIAAVGYYDTAKECLAAAAIRHSCAVS